MVSSDGFLSNMVSRDHPYSWRILEISLPHRFLPQNNQKCIVTKRTLTSAWSENVVKCDIEESETVTLWKVEVDINKHVEEHN
ncbi:hypothetical protein AVEN_237421-1 [Araneus ventricosus]|uniref:Uncharacterized protein n=1 Tax=Araneus ventricosus TaxID=182803 RepID=A0A4Y2KK29_ARAVE|nr:hypothetical protein AVEN_237421-1 [Araneus ventricosus]